MEYHKVYVIVFDGNLKFSRGIDFLRYWVVLFLDFLRLVVKISLEAAISSKVFKKLEVTNSIKIRFT